MTKPKHDLSPENTVCVVGQGYVGLPLARAAVLAGYNVVGLDNDRQKVDLLTKGKSPIEDVTDEQLGRMKDTGRYSVYDNTWMSTVHKPSVFVVTVPTPLTEGGKPDLSFVLSAANSVGPFLDGALVILESTVAPGTTRHDFTRALNQSRTDRAIPGQSYNLAFSPERIDPGNPTWRFRNTPKLVAGYTNACRTRAMDFYSSIMTTEPVPVPTLEIAETAKLLENTFRHVNIALVNELARHCHDMDIDVWEVITAASTKPYGFMPFWPGPGVGGHCLPVDPAYLGEKVKIATGNDFHFVDLAMRINDSQPEYVVNRIVRLLNGKSKAVNGSHILVLGYSYKPNTGDMRETPAADVVDTLCDLGADVYVVEPHSDRPDHFTDVKTAHKEAIRATGKARPFDMAVLLTDHDTFRADGTYEDVFRTYTPILDTRNAIESDGGDVVRL